MSTKIQDVDSCVNQKLLRNYDVCEKLGISQTTLWRWRQTGVFPNPRKVRGCALQGWLESTVDAWILENFSDNEEG